MQRAPTMGINLFGIIYVDGMLMNYNRVAARGSQSMPALD